MRDYSKKKAFNAIFNKTGRSNQRHHQLRPPTWAVSNSSMHAKQISAKVQDKSLIHVEAMINEKRAQALIGTGASHNFIKMYEAKRLGLKVEKINGWLKTLNLEAKPLSGVARDVALYLGPW